MVRPITSSKVRPSKKRSQKRELHLVELDLATLENIVAAEGEAAAHVPDMQLALQMTMVAAQPHAEAAAPAEAPPPASPDTHFGTPGVGGSDHGGVSVAAPHAAAGLEAETKADTKVTIDKTKLNIEQSNAEKGLYGGANGSDTPTRAEAADQTAARAKLADEAFKDGKATSAEFDGVHGKLPVAPGVPIATAKVGSADQTVVDAKVPGEFVPGGKAGIGEFVGVHDELPVAPGVPVETMEADHPADRTVADTKVTGEFGEELPVAPGVPIAAGEAEPPEQTGFNVKVVGEDVPTIQSWGVLLQHAQSLGLVSNMQPVIDAALTGDSAMMQAAIDAVLKGGAVDSASVHPGQSTPGFPGEADRGEQNVPAPTQALPDVTESQRSSVADKLLDVADHEFHTRHQLRLSPDQLRGDLADLSRIAQWFFGPSVRSLIEPQTAAQPTIATVLKGGADNVSIHPEQSVPALPGDSDRGEQNTPAPKHASADATEPQRSSAANKLLDVADHEFRWHQDPPKAKQAKQKQELQEKTESTVRGWNSVLQLAQLLGLAGSVRPAMEAALSGNSAELQAVTPTVIAAALKGGAADNASLQTAQSAPALPAEQTTPAPKLAPSDFAGKSDRNAVSNELFEGADNEFLKIPKYQTQRI